MEKLAIQGSFSIAAKRIQASGREGGPLANSDGAYKKESEGVTLAENE